MTLDEKKLLLDVQNCIESIDFHLESKRNINEYLSNKTKRRAVEREIEIIGEAINKLLKLSPSIEISYAWIIVDLRNKVIHAYDEVDDILIWKIIMKDLPTLHQEVSNLLHEN